MGEGPVWREGLAVEDEHALPELLFAASWLYSIAAVPVPNHTGNDEQVGEKVGCKDERPDQGDPVRLSRALAGFLAERFSP
jgi:hypothetical protein